ncbi:MAG: hypothetical protein ACKO0Z_19190 [Betaproteobacteria bacterium]
MPLLRRRAVFAAKIETTVGTAETLSASEGVFNARDFEIQPSISMTRREGQGGFNYLPSIPEGMSGTCKIVHDITYDGTNLPTWATVLLPACGFVETAGVFAPVSSGPGSGGVKTITLGHYKDGKRQLLSGAMGTFKITAETGKVAYIEFTFTGKYSSNETDTALIEPTYPTVLPLRFANGALTWNSVALCTAKVDVDAGNSVIMRECVNASDRSGYVSALVTNRIPVINADPESVLVATQNRDSLWLTPTTAAFSMQIGTTGTSVTVAAPAAQLENKQQGNRNNLMIDNLTWIAASGSSPDTELTITFD